MNMMFQQLSEELVKAREDCRLTPEQIAVKIKMDLKFLQKMENGDFSFLPELYLKSFLGEYAKCVGLNEQTILYKYKLAKEGKPLEAQLQHEVENTVQEAPLSFSAPKLITDDHLQTSYSPEKKFSFSSKQVIGIGAGALLLLFALIYWFVIKQSADVIVTERPYEESVQENKARFEEETAAGDSSLAAFPSDSLVLSLTSKDSSWVKVLSDDHFTKEYFLYPNTSIEIKASEKFSMTIGNPGTIKFMLNGQPLEFKPASTRRELVEVTKDGIVKVDQNKNRTDTR